MGTTLAAIIGSLAGDIAKEVVSASLARVVRRRMDEASQLLMEKVRIGDIALADAEAADDAVAMLFRFYRAANEGAARAALRLLASVMRNELVQPRPQADSFHRWADILAGLSHQEIIVLGEIHQLRLDHPPGPITSGALAAQITKQARDRISPTWVCKDEDQLMTVLAALTRTGLVLPSSGYGGGINYCTSGLMDELLQLVGLEELADLRVNAT